MFGKPKKDPKVVVNTPSPDDYRMSVRGSEFYHQSQQLLHSAIEELGPNVGISVVLSGITRELRRQFSLEMAEEIVRGLAASMKDAAQYDVSDDTKASNAPSSKGPER